MSLFSFSIIASVQADSSSTAAETDIAPMSLQQLERRIDELETQLRQSDEHLLQHDDSHSASGVLDRVHFSGFATFGMQYFSNVSDNVELEDRGKRLSTTAATLLGVQMEFEIAKRTDFIFQVKAYDYGDNTVEAEWAYLNHQFNDHWQLRLGAMRMPFFMLSEYLNVGYAQLWANTPVEVYGGTIDLTFTGANVGYHLDLDHSSHTWQAYGGSHYSTDVDPFIADLSVDDMLGLRYDVLWQQWRLGLSYTQGNVNASLKSPMPNVYPVPPQAVLPLGSDGRFYAAGLFYEGEAFSWLSEIVRQEVKGPYSDEQAWYSSISYRIGDWTPYSYYGALETVDDGDRDGSLGLVKGYMQRSAAAGLRYDFYANFALKAEVIHILDESYSDRVQRPNLSQGDAHAGKHGNFYTLKLDMVF